MEKARILFVDDEVAILDGLRDLLRKERGRWEMVFASGGQQALAECRKSPFHIVVSDMCMPGMDGAELLTQIKTEYPSATRILLSGHSERTAIMRALPVVHQFLSKPCDASVLRSTIERTHRLQVLLENQAIRAVVGRIERLPSVPATYLELTRAAADPSKGIADIANVIRNDPAMTAKALQLVNSAYFGTTRSVTSIHEAVSFLGIEMVKGLALTDAFAALDNKRIAGFSIERLQTMSVACAHAARRFIGSGPRAAEEAFTSSLVRDVGQIVIALGMPEELERVVAEARGTGRSLDAIETERFGITHAEIGAYLLGVWGLPFSIVEAVAHHHVPSRVDTGAREVLAAVHAADALVEEAFGGVARLDVGFLEAAGLADKLPRWRAIVAEIHQ